MWFAEKTQFINDDDKLEIQLDELRRREIHQTLLYSNEV